MGISETGAATMAVSNPDRHNQGKELDYLCVDSFIKNIIDARVLQTAFELQIIDALIENQSCNFDDLKKESGGDSRGLRFLLDLLMTNQVLEEYRGEITLSQQFTNALKYRDLLEAKLEFAGLVLPDFTDLFTTLVQSPERFARNARIFELFGYHRCFDYTPENFEQTKRWMRITTTFTKYEAQVCLRRHDFGPYQHILDVGGNSGEFVLQICREYPTLSATVFDLPLVCDIGREHIHSEPEADRIAFIKGDALRDPLPRGFDLIALKSILHDWPEKEAGLLIANAAKSLDPGGTLLIFERGPFAMGNTPLPYSMIPFLLFFNSFRSPITYEERLEDLNFLDIKKEKIDLETPFYLITAKKPLDQP